MRFFVARLCLIAALTTTPVPNSHKPSNPSPSPISSEVQSLKNEITRLEKDLQNSQNEQDRWNHWYFRLGIAAVVVGGVLGVLSWGAGQKAKNVELAARPIIGKIASKSSQLRDLIDHQSQEDVAQATQTAEEAKKRTGELEKEAAVERDRAAILEHKTEELRQQNLATESHIELERKKRLDLAVSLLPRNFSDQSGAINALSSLRPMTVAFEYIDEQEPRETAEQIAWVFNVLHWPCERIPIDSGMIFDGILITIGEKNLPDVPDLLFEQQHFHGERAAEMVRDALRNSGLEAELGGMAGKMNVPPTVLMISVGRKPNLVLEQSIKELGTPQQPTPLRGTTNLMGGNRVRIPEAKP